MIVVDTNVLSELMRPSPDKRVVAWLRDNAPLLALPSVAIGELRYGVARLPAGRRKASLMAALDALTDQFAGSLVSYDVLAARACGDMLAAAEAMGRPMNLADAQIGACAKVARARLATRSVKDFTALGLDLVNPWDG